MITIVEPKKYIVDLWRRPDIKEGDNVRMMRYVLRTDSEEGVLLHNVVTGQLVLLNRDEERLLNRMPGTYSAEMEEFAVFRYLVPEIFDEHEMVVKMRTVLRKLEDVQRKPGIAKYTIFPTTGCNARCYYCFEQGARIVTMSEQTANDVVAFIADHLGEYRSVHISWFGGEPTIATHRIDQICRGLQARGIEYTSDMTTNGYLFDEEMVGRAVSLWKLKNVMICLDGTEENYIKTKAYVNAKDNPYERVLRNIGLLLEKEIYVNLRVNFDLGNYHEFAEIIGEAKKRYQGSKFLQVKAHPVVGEYENRDGKIVHGDSAWFDEKTFELNETARNEGLQRRKTELASLKYHGCQAASPAAATITAEGKIVRCPEQFGDDQVTGDIREGIWNDALVQSWKRIGDYPKCRACALFPACVLIENCCAKDRCDYQKDKHLQEHFAAKYLMKNKKGN